MGQNLLCASRLLGIAAAAAVGYSDVALISEQGPTDEAKPAPSHSAGNAHDTLMSAAKNRSSRVHQSYKYPLVLQVCG